MGEKMKFRNSGFTLIEVMIVVVIVGILAAVAYPSYQRQVVASDRAEAQAALLGLAGAMERHFTTNNSYLGAATGGGDTGAPGIYFDQVPKNKTGDAVKYNLTIDTATRTTFTVRATPINSQKNDGFLEVDSLGVRRWDKNDNGNANEAGEDSWH